MKLYCPKCSSSNLYKKKSDVAVSGKPRWLCRDCKSRTTSPLQRHQQHQDGINLKDVKSKTLVITSAMANTTTHDETLGVLLNYCNLNDAQLLVMPVKYRNIDNINTHKEDPLIYDKQLESYLLRKNLKQPKSLSLQSC